MATRSRIGMVMEDGSVKSIYCHWDGYPSNNGHILLYNYQDPNKIKELISLGSISTLAPNISTNEPHSFDKPAKDVVVAYGRDRGESVDIRTDEDPTVFKKSDVEEWGYLFENGKWYVTQGYHTNRNWCELTQKYIDDHE